MEGLEEISCGERLEGGKLDKAVGDGVADLGYHIESGGIVVLDSIDYDTGKATYLGNLAAMVVATPIHIDTTIAQDREKFMGFFDGIVGGMALGIVALKEVGMGKDDSMAERRGGLI